MTTTVGLVSGFIVLWYPFVFFLAKTNRLEISAWQYWGSLPYAAWETTKQVFLFIYTVLRIVCIVIVLLTGIIQTLAWYIVISMPGHDFLKSLFYTAHSFASYSSMSTFRSQNEAIQNDLYQTRQALELEQKARNKEGKQVSKVQQAQTIDYMDLYAVAEAIGAEAIRNSKNGNNSRRVRQLVVQLDAFKPTSYPTPIVTK